jgi:hypothetical protein
VVNGDDELLDVDMESLDPAFLPLSVDSTLNALRGKPESQSMDLQSTANHHQQQLHGDLFQMGNSNNMSDSALGDSYDAIPPRLYSTRWTLLTGLSFIVLFGNFFLYSPIAILPQAGLSNLQFGGLIAVTYAVYACFGYLVRRRLREARVRSRVVGAAWLLFLASALRLCVTPLRNGTPAFYALLMLSQIMAAFSQLILLQLPKAFAEKVYHMFLSCRLHFFLLILFFVLLIYVERVQWFAESEDLMVRVSLQQAHALGVAMAFLLGPMVVITRDDFSFLHLCFFMLLLTIALLSILWPYRPLSPPPRGTHNLLCLG